jgi:hypothetical protein
MSAAGLAAAVADTAERDMRGLPVRVRWRRDAGRARRGEVWTYAGGWPAWASPSGRWLALANRVRLALLAGDAEAAT